MNEMTDKTMTLEQVRDWLRDVSDQTLINHRYAMADAITRHLSQPAEHEHEWRMRNEGVVPTDECECGAVRDSKSHVLISGSQPAERGEAVACDLYVEARQCDLCDHIGLNDAADGQSACSRCLWHGAEPQDDQCPECGSTDCMYPACPECGNRYTFLADRKFVAPPPAAGVPDGWKLVPVDPTPDMIIAGIRANLEHAGKGVFGSIYKAMLSAAPSPTIDDAMQETGR